MFSDRIILFVPHTILLWMVVKVRFRRQCLFSGDAEEGTRDQGGREKEQNAVHGGTDARPRGSGGRTRGLYGTRGEIRCSCI